MKSRMILVLCAAILAPGLAFAGPPSFQRGSGGKGPAEVSRTLRTPTSSAGSYGNRNSRGGYTGSSRGSAPALRSGLGGSNYAGLNSGTPILDALRGSNYGNQGNYGDLGSVLNELGRVRNQYNYRENQRKREEEYLKLERTQMITNAVVGVVGILAASQAQQRYAQPQAYCAPAPVPAGHYETRRTLVKDGYYATQQVWVPELRDPTSGAIIDGHYETHRQWVPPVYQETQVWVTH